MSYYVMLDIMLDILLDVSNVGHLDGWKSALLVSPFAQMDLSLHFLCCLPSMGSKFQQAEATLIQFAY